MLQYKIAISTYANDSQNNSSFVKRLNFQYMDGNGTSCLNIIDVGIMEEGISLLDLVSKLSLQNQVAVDDNLSCNWDWGDILEWFDNSTNVEAQTAIRETNDCDETPLHILLRRNRAHGEGEGDNRGKSEGGATVLDVVKRFIEVDDIQLGGAFHLIRNTFDGDNTDDNMKRRRSSITSLPLLGSAHQIKACAIKDSTGYLPLHIACEDRCCSFDVICKCMHAICIYSL